MWSFSDISQAISSALHWLHGPLGAGFQGLGLQGFELFSLVEQDVEDFLRMSRLRCITSMADCIAAQCRWTSPRLGQFKRIATLEVDF